MPLACDPTQTHSFTLKIDEGKPDAPSFRLRFLTAREWREYVGLGDTPLPKDIGGPAVVELLLAALAQVLIGWDRVVDREGRVVPFAPGRVEEILTVVELWELYYAGRAQSQLSEDDRKNSGSPSATGPAACAEPAGAGPTSAGIAPMPPGPSS